MCGGMSRRAGMSVAAWFAMALQKRSPRATLSADEKRRLLDLQRQHAEVLGMLPEIAGFQDRPEAIKAALDALDDKPFPPTLPEFLRACRDAAKRVGTKHFALEHKLTPEEIERNRQRIAAMRERLTDKMTKTAQEPMK